MEFESIVKMASGQLGVTNNKIIKKPGDKDPEGANEWKSGEFIVGNEKMDLDTGLKEAGDAISLILDKKYDTALYKFNHVIQGMDRNTPKERYCISYALCNKALTYTLMGKFKDAYSCYDLAIEITPDYWVPWASKGALLLEYSKANSLFTRIRVPSQNEGLKCLARAKQLKKEWWQFWKKERNPIADKFKTISIKI